MCAPLSRRQFLQRSAVASTATLFGGLAKSQLIRPTGMGDPREKLSAFPSAAVRLREGEFKRAADVNETYLDRLQVDRLLHSFRVTAGLGSTATPYGGWESPTTELRGHFAGGHFLSATAFAAAGASNSVLREKGRQLVGGLMKCQQANGNGYLSAFPEDLFEKLAKGTPVWAPFYTYHKIMAGLLDTYVQTGNEDALKVAEGMAGWVSGYFGAIGIDQRQRMLREEYGGMNEALVNLYALTKKERYLETARLFEQPVILDALAQRRDELQGLHANTNVPKIIGAARMYEVTGEGRYREIAEYFLSDILAGRSYAIGNTSKDEHWTTPDGDLAGTLGWENAECCVAYNLMKLNRHLFAWTGDAYWMDAYERTLFNARLGTQNANGLKQYFFPLAAGYWRAYGSPEDSFWCCTGTGAEDFAKFGDTIYFHRGTDIYVNQFVASTLSWKEEDVAITLETSFPAEPRIQVIFQTGRPHTRTLAIRIPSWAEAGGYAEVNEKRMDGFASAGSYLTVRRVWSDGDRLTVHLPMSLAEEQLPGDSNTVAALYGPLVLAAKISNEAVESKSRILTGRGTVPEGLPKTAPLPEAKQGAALAEWIQPQAAKRLEFRGQRSDGTALDVVPMYQVKDERYSVYWKRPS